MESPSLPWGYIVVVNGSGEQDFPQAGRAQINHKKRPLLELLEALDEIMLPILRYPGQTFFNTWPAITVFDSQNSMVCLYGKKLGGRAVDCGLLLGPDPYNANALLCRSEDWKGYRCPAIENFEIEVKNCQPYPDPRNLTVPIDPNSPPETVKCSAYQRNMNGDKLFRCIKKGTQIPYKCPSPTPFSQILNNCIILGSKDISRKVSFDSWIEKASDTKCDPPSTCPHTKSQVAMGTMFVSTESLFPTFAESSACASKSLLYGLSGILFLFFLELYWIGFF
ncbi:hypothetical protein CROQUDRAFT_105215 [Cronartium quercuum f. sp. fusiforme G11]|uniref:Uncharacterized protein n=1 Tax=Cronartium quercuum f. sp. fusiforme G11 TaxID=708437 RepID=A0A9P6NTL6_9BASI|nr:hypothetical protein CROQUDRAFT_105215 [Cronartium quercuum f. sp. fusiforme G11]